MSPICRDRWRDRLLEQCRIRCQMLCKAPMNQIGFRVQPVSFQLSRRPRVSAFRMRHSIRQQIQCRDCRRDSISPQMPLGKSRQRKTLAPLVLHWQLEQTVSSHRVALELPPPLPRNHQNCAPSCQANWRDQIPPPRLDRPSCRCKQAAVRPPRRRHAVPLPLERRRNAPSAAQRHEASCPA